jgi:hypothetical protein
MSAINQAEPACSANYVLPVPSMRLFVSLVPILHSFYLIINVFRFVPLDSMAIAHRLNVYRATPLAQLALEQEMPPVRAVQAIISSILQSQLVRLSVTAGISATLLHISAKSAPHHV